MEVSYYLFFEFSLLYKQNQFDMKERSLLAKHILGLDHQPKQRLQFPVLTQQRKHFRYGPEDQVQLWMGEKVGMKDVKHSKLDISDINGAKPRINHLTKSQKRMHSLPSEQMNMQTRDSLDKLARKSIRKRDSSLSRLQTLRDEPKQSKVDENFTAFIEQKKSEVKNGRELYRHLKTQSTVNDYNQNYLQKFKIISPQESPTKTRQKRSILQNPTYLSSLLI